MMMIFYVVFRRVVHVFGDIHSVQLDPARSKCGEVSNSFYIPVECSKDILYVIIFFLSLTH